MITSTIMIKRKKVPVALTIAGSDSGGGAGIQADLKTFAAMGVHGASAIACLTAQNPKRVLGIELCPPRMLQRQIEAVFEELPPAAAKTGMLYSAGNISVVADFFGTPRSAFRVPRLIVDPVLVATSGRRMLEPKALVVLQKKLLPVASLVTPNLPEAELLAGQKIASVDAMRAAARTIRSRFGCAVLVKGGHLPDAAARSKGKGRVTRRQAVDIFYDGATELLLTAPFVDGVRTHGTGCVYSAAICAALALGNDLPRAVAIGKNIVTADIANSYRIGDHFALGSW